jgi:hypothetical protein
MLFEPKSTDLGRAVIYRDGSLTREGKLTWFNPHSCDVKFSDFDLACPVRREYLAFKAADKDVLIAARLDELRAAGATSIEGPDQQGGYCVNGRWRAYPGSPSGLTLNRNGNPAFASWRQVVEAVKAAAAPPAAPEAPSEAAGDAADEAAGDAAA